MNFLSTKILKRKMKYYKGNIPLLRKRVKINFLPCFFVDVYF